jgi:hypothetical protein
MSGALDGRIDWALEYVARGWPVLPLYPVVDGECGCTSRQKRDKKCAPGKHPYVNLIHGVRDATLDPERVNLWWGERMWAKANIGVDLANAGLLDVAPDNVADLAEFIARGLPETLTFRSGSGEGHQHFLYKLPPGAPRARLCLSGHYDLMSDGYAVMPPSSTRGPYEWLRYATGMEPAEPPAWALELLTLQIEGRTPATEVSVPGDAVLGEDGEPPLDIDRRVWAGVDAVAGGRSGALWAIAGELAQAGANEATIVEALRERDDTLGWQKFSQRSDRERRYVETARRQLASVMPRIHINGHVTTEEHQYAPPPAPAWPAPLGEAAFHGLLGKVVRGIEPTSEADPAALLAHAIVISSAYLGPTVHARAGSARHPSRFFMVVVGDTSKGRKGTAAAPFRDAMLECDEPVRIASGLSSAEGLVFQVRDRLEKWNAKEQRYDVTDPGVADKRLVIIESEYATLLRRMEREGNAVSQLLRDAWDSGNLETLVKVNPTKATGAHINIIAHITIEELHLYLQPTEISSGSANRMLWFAARRSKLIPRGGNAPEVVMTDFAANLDRVRAWIGDLTDGFIDFSPAAGHRWDAGYPELSAGVLGLFGQATQRAEAQVLRIAVLYAMLDCSPVIDLVHLEAALAVWRYCNDSARWIFGGRTGDPQADTIVAALRISGELTRTQISDLFHRNVRADKISEALSLLLKGGLAVMEQRGAGVRTTEIWRPR